MAFTLQRLQRGVRRRLAAAIAPKPSSPKSPVSAFYPQQPTCQIHNLFHLLSKFLGERENGYFVEVGAYDGLFASNTWGLAERGWRGLLIEPVPELADACRRNYAHREGIRVAQVAIGDSNKEIVLHLAGTLTTANTKIHQEYAGIDWARNALTANCLAVDCRTLDQVLVEHGVPQRFDLLVVDVEGFEHEVFSGLDLVVWKPKMLIVELTDTHPDINETEGEDAVLSRTVAASGYVIAYKDHINTVFVRDDVWESAFGLPSECPAKPLHQSNFGGTGPPSSGGIT